jgi:predicted nucleic acid-binding protein
MSISTEHTTSLMVDSMIFDALLAEDAMSEAIRRAVADGSIELFVTHVQVDEIMDTYQRDPERAKRLIHTLLRSGAKEVPTYGFALDRSRLGLAAIADEETCDRIEAFQAGNPDHLEDALIAATAEHRSVILVTAERTRERYRTHFPGLTVWSVDDLRDLMNKTKGATRSPRALSGGRAPVRSAKDRVKGGGSRARWRGDARRSR